MTPLTGAVKESEGGWAAPVMVAVARDVYSLAFSEGAGGAGASKATVERLLKALQEAAGAVMTAREPADVDFHRSKRGAMVPVATLFIRAAFRGRNLVLCGPLFAMREHMPALERLPRAQSVPFRFMYGRLLLANGRYSEAIQELQTALRQLPRAEYRAAVAAESARGREGGGFGARRALYGLLVPLRMLWMQCPRDALLHRYGLQEIGRASCRERVFFDV
jgi:hypothetical protein